MKTGCSVKSVTHLVSCCLCIVILCLCGYAAPAQTTKEAAKPAGPAFTYTITDASHSTYGYDVFANGKLLVHQPSVPAMPGNDGFATKAAAEKVAKLVIRKLKKGEMPPTVSKEELKKLKAI